VIRGYFDQTGGSLEPKVQVGITTPWHPLPCFIDCLVDTGAGVSLLMPEDALGLGIQAEALWRRLGPSAEVRVRPVGVSVSLRRMSCGYHLAHEGGAREEWSSTILVAPPEPEYYGLPSILGWDVLRRFDLRLNAALGLVMLDSL